MDWIGLDFW